MNKNLINKIICGLFLLTCIKAYSQIIIGGTIGTAPADKKTAVLLEFEQGQNKGIILPSVRTLPSSSEVVPGTILLDASIGNSTQAKIRFYAPSNPNADTSGWVDLSAGNVANISAFMDIQPLSSGNNATTEDPGAKVIMGSTTTNANGVLVLESSTKVLLLPQVANTNDIKDPSPGMMVYVNGTNKRLAVFNGSKWTYWAP